MSKISVSFLVGFAIVSSVGAASAQSAGDAAISNSLSGKVLSMDGVRSSAKLGQTEDNGGLAATTNALGGGRTAQGTGVDIPVVKAKLGSGAGLDLPSNALMDSSRGAMANMANALQSPQAAGGEDSSLRSTVVLGTGNTDLSNSIGDQVRNNLKIGN